MTAVTKSATPTLKHFLWVGITSAALCIFAFQRLLWRGYQFVGNDFDLTQFWIPSSKFFRLWMHSGVLPQWNPYIGGGYALERPEEFYYSAINLMQWLLPPNEKTLDFLLAGHATLLAVCTAWVLLQYRFSPLVSVLGGLCLACTGTPCAQLFAGHISLYCILCWSSPLLLLQRQAMKSRALCWTLLYGLANCIPFAYGSYEGVYIVGALQLLFLGLQIGLGHPHPIQPLGFLSVGPAYEDRADTLFFSSSVPLSERLRDAGWALLKGVLAALIALNVAYCYWGSSFVRGYLVTNHPVSEATASPLCWVSLLIPSFLLGDGTDFAWTFFPGWEGAPGIGGSFLTLLLAGLVVSRSRRQLVLPLGLVLAGCAIGSGQYLPILQMYARLDPFVGLLEVPSRILFLCNFGFVLTLAWALQTLLDRSADLPSLLRPKLPYLTIPLALFWIATYYTDGSSPLWQWLFKSITVSPRMIPEAYYVISWTKLSLQLFLVSSLCYCLVRLPRQAFSPILALLVGVDLLSYPLPY